LGKDAVSRVSTDERECKREVSEPANQQRRFRLLRKQDQFCPRKTDIEDGFDQYLKAAFVAKKVPVTVVDDKSKADFEITGHSETQKASTAKKVIMWDWHSNEQASIQENNLKSGEVAFAYSKNKQSSVHGKKSTAEACAKHLKEKIESGK
jgi:hypothetical protein